ncbi:PE-PGRS family protein [Myxococcus hansupus]|uniref:PE-PGRS family protein n=1 Tax=Pseudomyxococcus hansupus TaxID=1297742 RepID=A0A0H4X7W6_9BACT|nr:MYXO-CTERM sorting domain-containing protein [Myxococcus hansupus]AKQ69670.1 PE-PGRS family protein [Myxococcus hansupus]
MRFVWTCLLVLLPASPALAELDSFGLGTGRHGALNVTASDHIVNVATPLTAGVNTGETRIKVERTTGFSEGMLVLFHQSGGPDEAVGTSGGTLELRGVGHWELARVAAVSSEPVELRLTAPLVHPFVIPGAQVVTVPEYTTVTVAAGATVAPRPWDGRSGGIVAFLATGSVTNQGLISAEGAGFRGGAFLNHPEIYSCTALDLAPEAGGSYKGEGLLVGRFGSAAGRGSAAGGGGGGNCHNAGGGGGANAGRGGGGGRSTETDLMRDVGGQGGVPAAYSLVEKFIFGSGGGAGEGNDDLGSGGGAGGGAVLLRARAFSGSGRITVDGLSALPTPGDDGAGGGGAGGALILRAEGTLGCGAARAAGGRGGTVSDPDWVLGPGGGGGGGGVLLQGTTTPCPTVVTGGAAGTLTASDGGTHGAGLGSSGVVTQYLTSYRTPTMPAVSTPVDGAVGVPDRPRFVGRAEPGVRVLVFVDGVERLHVVADAAGSFSAHIAPPQESLSVGTHTVHAVSESLGAFSRSSVPVTFSVAATLEDGGVVVEPILVIPQDGETVGTTPLFAGVAPNGLTVGIEVDNGAEVIIPVDGAGRFRYQWPAESPLAPGPHFVTVHSHNEAGISGPYSQPIRFESQAVSGGVDGGSSNPDAGSSQGDGGGTQVPEEGWPVLVVPEEGEVVDTTPLFAGAASPGATVVIEVDGSEVATVTADDTGAFRYQVPREGALSVGPHSVAAQEHLIASSRAPARSRSTAFQVRGPAALDVGCGCGASPVGMVGAWSLLVGLAVLARRRRA